MLAMDAGVELEDIADTPRGVSADFYTSIEGLTEALEHLHEPISRRDNASRFEEWARAWRQDTAHHSFLARRLAHPAFLRIIGMGREALPFIFRELPVRPGHWFAALSAITGENPIRPGDEGRVEKMAEAWIEWGRRCGYLP